MDRTTSQPGGTPGETGHRPAFVTTHWSVVLSAQDQQSPASAEALAKLCSTYWFPLYSFIRRQGRTAHDAQDLTQEFFARLLEKDYLKNAAREKGKFRSFLLMMLKHFLANEWDRQHALKRGGFTTVLSIDPEQAETRFAAEPSLQLQPEVLFDRQWAMTLLQRTMTLLQEEYDGTGRARLFELLRPCLAKEQSALPYARIAEQLQLSEAAVKMAVQRLRARYREILRQEITATVSTPEEVDEEIRYLFASFG